METAHQHTTQERIVLMVMVLIAFALLATNLSPQWVVGDLSLSGAVTAQTGSPDSAVGTILTILLAVIVLAVTLGLFIGMLLRRRKEKSSLLHVPGSIPKPLEEHLRFRFWKGKNKNLPLDEELQKVDQEMEGLASQEYQYIARKGKLHGFKHTTPKAQELSRPAERIFLQEELKMVEDELMHLERALPQEGNVVSMTPKTKGHAKEMIPKLPISEQESLR